MKIRLSGPYLAIQFCLTAANISWHTMNDSQKQEEFQHHVIHLVESNEGEKINAISEDLRIWSTTTKSTSLNFNS